MPSHMALCLQQPLPVISGPFHCSPLPAAPNPTASAAAVAYTSVCSLPLLSGVGHAAAVVLCGLSTALSLFCAYNVLAGGNPPPKAGGKGAAKTA